MFALLFLASCFLQGAASFQLPAGSAPRTAVAAKMGLFDFGTANADDDQMRALRLYRAAKKTYEREGGRKPTFEQYMPKKDSGGGGPNPLLPLLVVGGGALVLQPDVGAIASFAGSLLN